VSVLAVPVLFEAVKQIFTDEGVSTTLVFGRREPARQVNQGPGGANRIVFSPGADGKLGEYGPVVRPGRNPRSLGTLNDFVTVYCWGYDATQPQNDIAHYEAARLLHDVIFRALHIASHTTCKCNIKLSDPVWVQDKIEKNFGYELKFTLTIPSTIPDEAYTTVMATPVLTTEFETGET